MESEEKGKETAKNPGADLDSERPFTQPEAPAATSFLSLPPEIREIIYKHALALAHPLCLIRASGRVKVISPKRPLKWLALLCSHTTIYREARAVAYGSNRFSFRGELDGDFLQYFLDGIGPVNAGFLSHICIDFPTVERIEGQTWAAAKLKGGDLQTLKLFRERCTGLRTLETVVRLLDWHLWDRMGPEDWCRVLDALPYIDAQLRSIRSLMYIVIRFQNGPIAPSAEVAMRKLGWVVLHGIVGNLY